ncbi:hypothetical protein SAMN06273572_10231 [Monaibacterium marinum]|uniref:Uncharacterized protein n=1 Tax=Pontivivens marinum TaxID=1690039 RepID=A0A2C9CQ91_9RHOB|nr:hypothetical protein [Monaibacterium marinum]SOH93355.1 hypothetical protein SAMN06273572_10231 [Monaibacterium marinum]
MSVIADQVRADIAGLRADGVSAREAQLAIGWRYLRAIERNHLTPVRDRAPAPDPEPAPTRTDVPPLVSWTKSGVAKHGGYQFAGPRLEVLRRSASSRGFNRLQLIEQGVLDCTTTKTIGLLKRLGLMAQAGQRRSGRGNTKRLRAYYRATALGRDVLRAIEAGPDAPPVPWLRETSKGEGAS